MSSAAYRSGATSKDRDKLLDLFISEERAWKLTAFNKVLAGRKAAVTSVDVPGSPGEQYTVATDVSIDLTCELVRFFVVLHYLGFSFRGTLSLDEIFFTPTGSMRLLDTAFDKLEVGSPSDERLDADFVAKSIRGGVFAGVVLPTDMESLLHLLENEYGPALRLAVYNYPGLLRQGEKLSQFGLLYMNLREIEKVDPKKYEKITESMPFCSLDEDHWKFKALQNEYLETILFYNQEQTHPKSRKFQPPANAPSMSKGGQPNPQGQSKPQSRKYKPGSIPLDDAFRADRALKNDPLLLSLIHSKLQQKVRDTLNNRTNSGLALPNIAPGDVEDRKVLFKIVLDDMDNYKNDGKEMLRDIRNCAQHIPDAFLKLLVSAQQPPAPPASAQLPAINQAASAATTVQSAVSLPMQQAAQPTSAQQQGALLAIAQATTTPTAVSGTAPAAPPAPEYYTVESIFGTKYPGALCDFFLAMVRENQVTYLYDIESFLRNFSP